MTSPSGSNDMPRISWQENSQSRSAVWRSERRAPPPHRVIVIDDSMAADVAYRLVCNGAALLWRGDYFNGRQLLTALAKRVAKTASRKPPKIPAAQNSPHERFRLHRLAQAHEAQVLSSLLIEMNADYRLDLRRAPSTLAEACIATWGAPRGTEKIVFAMRELQGVVSAYEWRKRGVEVSALGGSGANHRIHPHYGVFAPIRGEYVTLVRDAPLPAALNNESLAFDIGTGSGVLAAVLARRGVKKIIATDCDLRALACANENLRRLEISPRTVVVKEADLFPNGTAPLIVCNPPWLPAKASAPIERAVYDEDSAMLRGFLARLATHLAPSGEAWLILSDLAEHLQLRTRDQLNAWMSEGGLKVIGRIDTRPTHPKSRDASDPMHAARAKEVISLWRLAAQ